MAKYNKFPPGITKELFERSAKAKLLGIDNTLPARLLPNAYRFAWEVMLPIQNMFGEEVWWDSLYRCPALNTAVGGSSTSDHMKAQAGDLHLKRTSPVIAHAMIKGSKIQLKQCIRYDWGNHLGLNASTLSQRNEYIVKD